MHRFEKQILEKTENKYEACVVAAKEAERLNNYYRELLKKPKEKVTILALKRLAAGKVKFTYEEESKEEENK